MRRLFAIAIYLLANAAELPAQTLKGSSSSVSLQNRVAREHHLKFARSPEQLMQEVKQGRLVRVRETPHFDLHKVSFPYAHQAVATFIQRLAAQYHRACGEKLVVTSLSRPMSRQPANASPLSVHPAGMALDLRVPQNGTCRRWLESTLLELEAKGLIDATLERRPPHYHVAVFPDPYQRYVRGKTGGRSTKMASTETYKVRSGDTLWGIARRHGTTVDRLAELNRLEPQSNIYPGQTLQIPAKR